MDDFSVKPWVPNAFGLVGNAANAIQPGKRPLSSMTPTIVLKNKEPFIILGSPGGSRIITAVLQTILNVTIHNMNIQEAVSAPRVHSQWLPDVIMAESYSIIRDVERSLKDKGHKILRLFPNFHQRIIIISTRYWWSKMAPWIKIHVFGCHQMAQIGGSLKLIRSQV